MSRFSSTAPTSLGRRVTKYLVQAGVGAIFGFAGAYTALRLLESQGGVPDALRDLQWSDLMAVVVGSALLLISLVLAVISFFPKTLAQSINAEGPATRSEQGEYRMQALGLAVSAIILPMPVLFDMAGQPMAGLLIILALLVPYVLLSIRIFRRSDELMRRIMVEQSAVTLMAGQLLLFAYAAAERLGYVPSLTAWDVYNVTLSFYLITAMIVVTRRGLG